ncbi:MAG: alpha/beta hydrolase [Gemmatimonadota bacterium]|nr:alpha/beta hydrolase [Gemmatimonadota bacterium]
MRVLTWLLTAALVVTALLVGLRLLLPRVVSSFVFFPEPLSPDRTDPSGWGWPEAEEIRFEAADGTALHGWLFPARGERRGSAIYLHGNAGNVTIRGEAASTFAELGLDVLVFDYRGYGASEGTPNESGLYADAEGAWTWWVDDRGVDPSEIVLIGGSLGAAVAVETATRREVAALVLVVPLPGTKRVARHTYSFLPDFVFAWETPAFDSVERVRDVHAPVLIAHATEDHIVPREGARAIAENAGGPVTWHESEGYGHAGAWGDPTLWRALDGFLGEVLRPE